MHARLVLMTLLALGMMPLADAALTAFDPEHTLQHPRPASTDIAQLQAECLAPIEQNLTDLMHGVARFCETQCVVTNGGAPACTTHMGSRQLVSPFVPPAPAPVAVAPTPDVPTPSPATPAAPAPVPIAPTPAPGSSPYVGPPRDIQQIGWPTWGIGHASTPGGWIG